MAELTPKASRKLAALLQTAQDAEGAAAALRPKRAKLEEAVALAERRARAYPEDDAAAQIAEDLARELVALTDEQERRRERYEKDMIVYNRAREWANLLPYRAVLTDVAAPKPEGDLAFLRDQIAKLKEVRGMVSQAIPLADELATIVKQYVERIAADYRPRLTMTTGGGLLADFAYVNVVGNPLAPFGVLCWVARDLVTARLTAEVAAQIGAGTGTMTAEQRGQWMQQSAELMDAAERTEEALVEAALASGVDVARRYDASPAAVLGVVLSNMAAAAA
jgi:hypothetical protein